MQIVPVIDLQQGQVVRGVAGRRSEYRPIVSRIAASSAPADIAQAFVARYGFRTAYVADLDAIAGAEPALAVYDQIAAAGLGLWVDAGAGCEARATTIAAHPAVERLVIGLESLPSYDALARIATVLPPTRLIFSLDLRAGRPLTTSDAWRGKSPLEIARLAVNSGIQSLIVLDLAGVGMGSGPQALPLGRTLRASFPEVELVGGGGVRGPPDVDALAAAGFDAALIASALHDGAWPATG